MSWFVRTKDEAETAGAWLETGLKLVAIIAALTGAGTGVYAAWFRPETKAREAYVVTSVAVEEMKTTIGKIAEGHDTLDRHVAIELAKINQRLDDFEKMARRRYAYEPSAAGTVVVEERAAPLNIRQQQSMPAAAKVFE